MSIGAVDILIMIASLQSVTGILISPQPLFMIEH